MLSTIYNRVFLFNNWTFSIYFGDLEVLSKVFNKFSVRKQKSKYKLSKRGYTHKLFQETLFKWICTRSPVGTQRSWFIFLKTVKIDTKDDWSMIIKSVFKIECNWIWSAFLQRSRGVTNIFSQASPKKQNLSWIAPLALGFLAVMSSSENFSVALSEIFFKPRNFGIPPKWYPRPKSSSCHWHRTWAKCIPSSPARPKGHL